MVARCAQEGLDVSRSALAVSWLPRAAYECAPAASDRSPGSRACRHHQAGRRSYAAALLRHASPGAEDRYSDNPGFIPVFVVATIFGVIARPARRSWVGYGEEPAGQCTIWRTGQSA